MGRMVMRRLIDRSGWRMLRCRRLCPAVYPDPHVVAIGNSLREGAERAYPTEFELREIDSASLRLLNAPSSTKFACISIECSWFGSMVSDMAIVPQNRFKPITLRNQSVVQEQVFFLI